MGLKVQATVVYDATQWNKPGDDPDEFEPGKIRNGSGDVIVLKPGDWILRHESSGSSDGLVVVHVARDLVFKRKFRPVFEFPSLHPPCSN